MYIVEYKTEERRLISSRTGNKLDAAWCVVFIDWGKGHARVSLIGLAEMKGRKKKRKEKKEGREKDGSAKRG